MTVLKAQQKCALWMSPSTKQRAPKTIGSVGKLLSGGKNRASKRCCLAGSVFYLVELGRASNDGDSGIERVPNDDSTQIPDFPDIVSVIVGSSGFLAKNIATVRNTVFQNGLPEPSQESIEAESSS